MGETTDGGSISIEAASKLTGEELGGALLYSFATHLRLRDGALPAIEQAKLDSHAYGVNANFAELQATRQLAEYLLEHPEYTFENRDDIPLSDEVMKLSRDALTLGALGEVAIARATPATVAEVPSFTDEMLKWPIRKTIVVRDPSSIVSATIEGPIRRLKHHGRDHSQVYSWRKSPKSIVGKITNIELHGDNGGLLRVKTKRGVDYEVSPLISQVIGYRPAVEISFLD